MPSVAARVSSIGAIGHFVAALLEPEDPARDAVAGFQLHPPFLHTGFGDVDVTLSLVGEATGAFKGNIVLVFGEPDALAPKGYETVRVQPIAENLVALGQRTKRLINFACQHTPVRLSSDIDRPDRGHLCSARKVPYKGPTILPG